MNLNNNPRLDTHTPLFPVAACTSNYFFTRYLRGLKKAANSLKDSEKPNAILCN